MDLDHIPAVDLKSIGIGAEPLNEDLHTVGELLYKAFKDIGFVYVTNHGIPEPLQKQLIHESRRFFALPEETKMQYERFVKSEWNGYMAMGKEHLDDHGGGAFELKESYNMLRFGELLPEADAPGFSAGLREVSLACDQLALRLVRALETAAGRPGEIFSTKHGQLRDTGMTMLRVAYYPPVQVTDGWPPAGAVRCADHTDWGTLTLLMQDATGGLEVMNRTGVWVPAPHRTGAVLVNIGDLMEVWSGGELRASRHRVPFSPGSAHTSRVSVVYFCAPAADALVSPPHWATDKYQPILTGDYVQRKAEKLQDKPHETPSQ